MLLQSREAGWVAAELCAPWFLSQQWLGRCWDFSQGLVPLPAVALHLLLGLFTDFSRSVKSR